jgi:hypothetical protein
MSVVVQRCPWLFRYICPWLFRDAHGCSEVSVVVKRCPWLFRDVRGCSKMSVVVQRCPWLFKDVRGCSKMSMVVLQGKPFMHSPYVARQDKKWCLVLSLGLVRLTKFLTGLKNASHDFIYLNQQILLQTT